MAPGQVIPHAPSKMEQARNGWVEIQSPRPSWPNFYHPHTATLLGIVMVVTPISILFVIFFKSLVRRLTRARRPTVVVTGLGISHDQPDQGDYADIDDPPPIRQLVISIPRSSVYTALPDSDTGCSRHDPFRHTRSMAELSTHSLIPPLGKDPKKTKTIHWHGINQLNTTWGWMA